MTSNKARVTDLAATKIKVTSAKMMVRAPRTSYDAPYYYIEYHDVEKGQTFEGFGSYCPDFVRQWLEECFEVVEPEGGDK